MVKPTGVDDMLTSCFASIVTTAPILKEALKECGICRLVNGAETKARPADCRRY